MYRHMPQLILCLFLLLPTLAWSAPPPSPLTPIEELGQNLYFDTSLSNPPNQACASCHAPRVGFTIPIAGINRDGAVMFGAVRTAFGPRKAPTAAYAGDSPLLSVDADGVFTGGMFWDGRATGAVTGDPLADQAMGPFLNPVEMNMPDEESVCLAVADSRYADLFEVVYGPGSLDCSAAGVHTTYMNIARAIAAFERSGMVSAFSSKFDAVAAGLASFTAAEANGWVLFNNKANCAACHPAPLFTDFTFDNLGVPANPDNPFYATDPNFVDLGLGGFLATTVEWADLAAANLGKHKVPTLRNVDLRPGPGFAKAYGHNGVFKSLAEIVHFYNDRDVMIAAGLVTPEVWTNMNQDELGALGLSASEEADLVAFLQTLSDGYVP